MLQKVRADDSVTKLGQMTVVKAVDSVTKLRQMTML